MKSIFKILFAFTLIFTINTAILAEEYDATAPKTVTVPYGVDESFDVSAPIEGDATKEIAPIQAPTEASTDTKTNKDSSSILISSIFVLLIFVVLIIFLLLRKIDGDK